MIDRYSITATSEKISERFSVEILAPVAPSYNASPTHILPVITGASPKGLSTFYWGTSPQWSKNKQVSEKIVNVRAEDIQEKVSLKKALAKSRCIIPADGFYAWKKTGKKTMIPYRFVVTDQELFSFAGLWEEYEDTEGNDFHTFTIITTQANELVSTVCERMPVIFTKTAEKVWLDAATPEDELMNLLVRYPTAAVSLYPVSPRISDVNVNVPSLILPTAPADQHGNLTLFD
jgi:putative SOS response-associated peptidase YedK